MADGFIGEVRAFCFDFAPQGWAFCNGTLMSIQQNPTLFAIIGNQYGGNGQSTFALPDLQGRAPVAAGVGPDRTFEIAHPQGTPSVSLLQSEMPYHTHTAKGLQAPTGATLQAAPANDTYLSIPRTTASPPATYDAWTTSAPSGTLAPNTLGQAGGSQAHSNLSPYLTVNFCICLDGEFPVRQ